MRAPAASANGHRTAGSRGRRSAEEHYEYRGADGTIVYEVVRRPPKAPGGRRTFLQRRPDGSGGWIYNLDGVERVPYRLPELRKAIDAGVEGVLIVEGERDVDRARELGLAATTSAGGAGWLWPEDWADHFRGADRIYVIADNDVPGSKAGSARAALLAGVDCETYFVAVLPGLETTTGADLSDYLDRLAAEGLSAGEQCERLWRDLDRVAERVPRRSGAIAPAPHASPQRYEVTSAGIYHRKDNGQDRLTNFGARIRAEIIRDDGAEQRRVLEIEATLDGRTSSFMVLPEKFDDVRTWSLTHIGAGAILYPGRDRAGRVPLAIQEHSVALEIGSRRIFEHTGWLDGPDADLYVTAGGAIGSGGAVDGVEVELRGVLERLSLPAPPQGDDLSRVTRAVLGLLELGPDRITVPCLGASLRAPLGRADFTVFLCGSTGTFKTSLAAVCQQFYGSDFDDAKLPLDWSSTGNAIAEVSFLAKDVLLCVDDFKPEGTRRDQERVHRASAQVLRGQGNGTGRNRLARDGGLRVERPPRGLMLATGEELPRGESIRARVVVLDVERGDIREGELTAAQDLGRSGTLAEAMAGYIQWLAGLGSVERSRRRGEAAEKLRTSLAYDAVHRRSARAAAELGAGWMLFLDFACEMSDYAATEAAETRRRVEVALAELVRRQREHQLDENPCTRFLQGLRTALSRGSAHLASSTGSGPPPQNPEALGWRRDGGSEQWAAQGRQVGWADAEHAYLDREGALIAADEVAEQLGASLGLGVRALAKELGAADVLVLSRLDKGRGNVERKLIGGVRQDIWPLYLDTVLQGKAVCARN